MKTLIVIGFLGESALVTGKRPIIEIDGPVPLPEIGEHVHCSVSMLRENPNRVSGNVVSRSFRYEPDEVYVMLTLKDSYEHTQR